MDSIRIVPLYVPQELLTHVGDAAPISAPQLTYRGGPLLTNVDVHTVFWGSAWQTGAQKPMVDQINGFFDFILTSPLLDQLSEYNTPNLKIGRGQRSGTTTITTPTLGRSVTDAALRQMLQTAALPAPGPNRLYFVYLEPGVSLVQGNSRSCQAFCGYHDTIDGKMFYAAMPYANCTGCQGGLSIFDALTSTSSHELCEAITDPVPGQGWYDDQNGEIGDICAWKTKKIGAYTVQLEWSNKANACV